MDNSDAKQPNKVLIGIVVAVVLVAITAAVVLLNGKETPTKDSANTTTTQTPTSTPTTPSSSTASTGAYKNGEYKANGTYQSPGGTETVHLTVTLTDSAITAVDMTTDPTGATGKSFQNKFLSGYKELVIGKKVDQVSLDRVAGSSLTSGGFNRALDQIKSDAKV